MIKLRDSFRVFSYLNVYRLWNVIILRFSFHLSKITRRNFHFGMPSTLSIEPTTACNLGCPECPSGLKQFSRPTGKLDLDFHERMLAQIKSSVFYINYYFQGEPFLHPHFLTLIAQAKKSKIYTSTSTNAHFINQKKANEIVSSGLDRLIISIDGLTQQTYEQYRVNGKLNKVIEASKLLVESKTRTNSKTPHLIFQFLAVKPNEHEVPEIFDLAREIGIDEVRIKTAQLYDYKNGNRLMPDNSKYSRYVKRKDGTFKLKGRQGNHCWRMWSGSVFTWDGGVVPCCFDKDASHILGSLKDKPFKEIWNAEKYKEFRQSILNAREQIDIRKNCSEGSKVWV